MTGAQEKTHRVEGGRVQQLVSANSSASGRGFAIDGQPLGPIAEGCGRDPGCGRCVRRYESPAAHYPSRRVNGTSVASRCLDQLHSARSGGKLRSYFFFFCWCLSLFVCPSFLSCSRNQVTNLTHGGSEGTGDLKGGDLICLDHLQTSVQSRFKSPL